MLTAEEKEALDKAIAGTTMQDWHRLFCMDAIRRGEWAGCPLPIQMAELVIEPRSPYAHMNGARMVDDGIVCDTDSDDADDNNIKFINAWFTQSTGMEVMIFEINGKREFIKRHHTLDTGRRVDMLLNLIGASCEVWDIDTEMQAMKKLRSLVKPHIYKYYLLTGAFIETSPRSGVTYIFRRSRPTIALTNENDHVRILTTLCLHPIGYYKGTWSGTMVPTDDVIAHLLMMRGDEHYFWKKANHHPTYAIESGL